MDFGEYLGEMDAEMNAKLERLTEDAMAAGLSPEEVSRAVDNARDVITAMAINMRLQNMGECRHMEHFAWKIVHAFVATTDEAMDKLDKEGNPHHPSYQRPGGNPDFN